MNNSDPWNNQLTLTPYLNIKKLCKSDFDKNREFILGTKIPLTTMPKDNTLVFVGTDVSGNLHLGHAVLFSLADLLSKYFHKHLVVSINELESIFTRRCDLEFVIKKRNKIIKELGKYDCTIHSRVNDWVLILLSASIWNYLLKEKKGKSDLFKHYKYVPDARDMFSIAVMAASPIGLCITKNQDAVLAVYGVDEYAHLELIYKLYQSTWFKAEIRNSFNMSPPLFNYLIIKPLQDETGRYKMSKSRPETTIFIDSFRQPLKESQINTYLCGLLNLLESSNTDLSHNGWYLLIKEFLNKYD